MATPVVNIPAISTLGIKFGYAVETTAGQKPTNFIWLPRCTEIGEISLDQEDIDASALEDYTTRYVAGRQDSGGDWSASFFCTSQTRPLLKAMMTAAANGLKEGKNTWFEVWNPSDPTGAVFVVGQPGTQIPLPAISANETYVVSIPISIVEYKEYDDGIEPQLPNA